MRRDSRPHEFIVHSGEPQFERQGHVIAERQWGGAGASFSTVDRDEIDAAGAVAHELSQLAPERQLPHRRLDAHGQAAEFGQPLHESRRLSASWNSRWAAGLAQSFP